MDLYGKYMNSKEQELITACKVFEVSRVLQATWEAVGSHYELTVTNYFHEVVGITSIVVQTNKSYYYITKGDYLLDSSIEITEALLQESDGGLKWHLTGSNVEEVFKDEFPIWMSPGDSLIVKFRVTNSEVIESIFSSFVEGSGGVGSISYVKSS